jgi:glycosyltransferase involved in cell wall biosynthesis
MELNDITVYITVRNEEERIKACLKRLLWAKEIIIFDKESTDKTVMICRELGANVISVPNYTVNNKGAERFKQNGSGNWCLFLTASDLLGAKLKDDILKIINKKNDTTYAVALPFLTFSFGVHLKMSPFSGNSKVLLIRRDKVLISKAVHQEIGFNGDKFLKIKSPKIDDLEAHVMHLSNETVLDYMKKFPRYMEMELHSKKNGSFFQNIKLLIKSIIIALIYKPSYIYGRRGLTTTCAYLSYVFARFAIQLDKSRNEKYVSAAEHYEKIRNHGQD